VTLVGALAIPPGANGVVVFAHGSGSSRHSPRNQFVARVIRESGNGTLLFDLLTAEEEIEDNVTRSLRFDSGLLASRLAEVTSWSRAADGPISRVMRCRACSRRRWASWAETMTR
jgi:predicted alpha/beta-hydrolase family hydrolase